MKFAGLIKNSFVDYPNEIAAVVFTLGCNFNCWYCHNDELINPKNKSLEIISEEEVIKFLENRKGFLDGLVITGGEPTLHSDLKEFIIKVRNLGFKIKLDTNGTNPEILKNLIDENLVDFVAMDIKNSLAEYEKIVGNCCKVKDIEKSIKILMNSKINYEFRTTFSPDISISNIEEIAKMIKGAKSYVIQKYNARNESDPKPHPYNDFLLSKEIAQKYVKTTLRSLD